MAKDITEADKIAAQKELEEFRKTRVAYLSEEDIDMDFSKVDDPNYKTPSEPKKERALHKNRNKI